MSDAGARRPKYLYFGASLLFILLTFVGFHFFYLEGRAYPGRPLTPAILPFILIHGLSMTLWILLFAVQTYLIAANNRRAHMWLGKISAVLAVLAVYYGIRLSIGGAAVNPPQAILWSMDPPHFLLVSMSAAILFGWFVLLGIVLRKNPAIHRPMMLLAALVAVAPAIDRIAAIKHLFEPHLPGRLLGPYFPSLFLGVALLLWKWASDRKLDRALAAGLAFLFVSGVFVMRFAPTEAWANIAGRLIGAAG